jgi:glycosyltransferase involved in cell wall biosynthesis
MKVVFFQRKSRHGFFSIEQIFEEIRSALPLEMTSQIFVSSFFSKGFFRRLFVGLEAMFNQGDINHVTGDIHFIVMFLKSKRTILTIHDIGFINHPNFFKRYLLKQFWLTLPIKRAAKITVVSQATKAELLRMVGLKFEPKIEVIHNFVSDRYKPCSKEFASERPRILQIGTKYNKNLLRLIEAISPLQCKLQIIGELTIEHLDSLVKHKIDFVNSSQLTNEQMLVAYHKADIVSFVSTYEGFGMPIIEANAVGRVVITSDVLSMPEVAGNAAHLVDPFDVNSIRAGFELVIQDSLYREKLIVNGFENVTRFRKNKIIDQYAKLYRSFKQNPS